MGVNKRGYYSPWGYQEENDYQSSENQFELELNELFASAAYNEQDKKIHFFNNDGEELSGSTIDTTQFASSVVEEAYYDSATKELVIKFSNGDEVRINMAEIIDENEFADGLQVNSDGIVSVKIDESGETYLSVSEDGIKISGVDAAIQVEADRATAAEEALDAKIEAETARAESAETELQAAIEAEGQRAQDAETALDAKIDQEIADRTADVDAEETRAKAKEDEIEAALNAEIARSTREDSTHDDELRTLNTRVGLLDTKLDSEITRSTSADTVLDNKITAEETRAKAAEQALQTAIGDESDRAISAETALDEKIGQEIDDRKAEAVAEVSYDSENKSIVFNNKNGETLSTIDATPFIKDGMIDSVELIELSGDTYLRITWNTDSGKEVTDINIGDIFDADNYYTKDETDALVDAEEARAISAETDLQTAIEAEEQRAISAETALGERIDEIASGSSELLDALIEKLGYTDNDTIERNNGGSEVAFGTYNISTQSDDPAQKTLFSIGNGTDDANRNNALEVKQNGDLYLWVEGEFMNVNRLLAQIAHEIYDSDAAANNPHYFDGD